ncbi:tail fiber protein [Erythrobacter sp. SCSIO 43205]|uniref:phage tail protein n=1 Tax=Erythrobacter sp. SCSIO 43205 TaxID=2779361 RepID=UPI001CA7F19D|nr:tail fiber protein [Erythrobacter sp. SCSIO 43205]UAB77254.1 tail fiber protein [Erythrobacter sp. SCSIO 43205]
MKKGVLTAGVAALAASFLNMSAPAQAREPFIGEIMQFGGNFCPRGWAKTEGQLLPISQYSALFSLLGTAYGGDGRTTFGLPDLRGRVAVGVGQGPGLSNYRWGEKGGREKVTSPTVGVDGSASADTSATRGGMAEDTRQPYLAITTCIALQGIYPSRS